MVVKDTGDFEAPPAEVLAEAAEAFGLLASPARLHIVWALAQGESDVTHSGPADRRRAAGREPAPGEAQACGAGALA